MQVKWDKIEENLGKKLKFQTTIDWQELLEKDPRQFALYFHACLPFKISIFGIKFPVAFRSCVTDASSSMSAFKYFMPKFKEVKDELHTTNPKQFIDHCFENVFSKLFQSEEVKQEKKMEAINDVGNRVLIHLITMDKIKNEPNVIKIPLVSIHNNHLLSTLKQTPLTKQEVIDTEKRILDSITLSIEDELKLLKLYEFGKPHERVIKEYSNFLQELAASNNNNNNNNNSDNKNSTEKKPRKSRKTKQEDTPKKKSNSSISPKNSSNKNKNEEEKSTNTDNHTTDMNSHPTNNNIHSANMDAESTTNSTDISIVPNSQNQVNENLNSETNQQEDNQALLTNTKSAQKTKKKAPSEKKKTPKKQKLSLTGDNTNNNNSSVDLISERIPSETNLLSPTNHLDPADVSNNQQNISKNNMNTPKKRGPNKKRNEADEVRLFQDSVGNNHVNNDVVKERKKNKQSSKQIDLVTNSLDQKQRISVSSVNNEELEAFKNLLFQTFCHVLHSEEKVAHVAISALIKTNHKLKDILCKMTETDLTIQSSIDQNIDNTIKDNSNHSNQNIHIDNTLETKLNTEHHEANTSESKLNTDHQGTNVSSNIISQK